MSEKRAADRSEKYRKFWQGVFLVRRKAKEILAIIITVAMLFTAVCAIIYRDRLNLDALKRWVAYGSLEKDEEGQTEEFVFSGDSNNHFAALGGGLLVSSNHAITLYSQSGEEVVRKSVSMEQPVVYANGTYAVVYDVGGDDLYIFHGNEEVFSYNSSSDGIILSAKVNENGYLALVEQTSGHKASVTVYDNSYNRVIGVNESTNFVTDAMISPDNKSVAVLKIYQEESQLNTDLVRYSLSDATLQSETHLKEQVVIDMGWKEGRIWLQQESGVTVLDSEGKLINTWSDTTRYLSRYTLGGNGFAVQLMSRYRSGSAGELRVIDDNGQQKVSRNIKEEVLSISAANQYIAVLTTSSLTIYTKELQEYASVSNLKARQAILRNDGSVLMVGTDRAYLFVP